MSQTLTAVVSSTTISTSLGLAAFLTSNRIALLVFGFNGKLKNQLRFAKPIGVIARTYHNGLIVRNNGEFSAIHYRKGNGTTMISFPVGVSKVYEWTLPCCDNDDGHLIYNNVTDEVYGLFS